MKTIRILLGLGCVLFTACQSPEADFMPLTAENPHELSTEVAAQQISEDVNSAEVSNVVKALFDKKEQSRSTDYNVKLFKGPDGQDRIIAVNFSDNKGFVLLSAVKTHAPILAYAEEGNFNVDTEDATPLTEWWETTMEDISLSKDLPEDSLRIISKMWRYFEEHKAEPISRSNGDEEDHSQLKTMTDEQYAIFSRQIMDRMVEWRNNGYTYYPIDNYYGSCDLGDKNAIVNYVRGRINPMYEEDYWALTFILEKEHNTRLGKGHWFETNWQQDNGFDQSFGLYFQENRNFRAGCGNVAVGQVMYAYKYPTYFNWAGMVLSAPGNKVTSDFLYDVSRKAGSDPDLDDGAFGSSQEGRAMALTTYGYTFEEVDASGVTSNNLFDKCPAIVSSYLEKKDPNNNQIKSDNHAWIVEGGQYLDIGTEIEIWTVTYSDQLERIYNEEVRPDRKFFINWGWGHSNGYYYLAPTFSVNRNYNSKYINKALINIKPANQ